MLFYKWESKMTLVAFFLFIPQGFTILYTGLSLFSVVAVLVVVVAVVEYVVVPVSVVLLAMYVPLLYYFVGGGLIKAPFHHSPIA